MHKCSTHIDHEEGNVNTCESILLGQCDVQDEQERTTLNHIETTMNSCQNKTEYPDAFMQHSNSDLCNEHAYRTENTRENKDGQPGIPVLQGSVCDEIKHADVKVYTNENNDGQPYIDHAEGPVDTCKSVLLGQSDVQDEQERIIFAHTETTMNSCKNCVENPDAFMPQCCSGICNDCDRREITGENRDGQTGAPVLQESLCDENKHANVKGNINENNDGQPYIDHAEGPVDTCNSALLEQSDVQDEQERIFFAHTETTMNLCKNCVENPDAFMPPCNSGICNDCDRRESTGENRDGQTGVPVLQESLCDENKHVDVKGNINENTEGQPYIDHAEGTVDTCVSVLGESNSQDERERIIFAHTETKMNSCTNGVENPDAFMLQCDSGICNEHVDRLENTREKSDGQPGIPALQESLSDEIKHAGDKNNKEQPQHNTVYDEHTDVISSTGENGVRKPVIEKKRTRSEKKKTHGGGKKSKRRKMFKCDLCSFSSQFSNDLIRHKKTHTEETFNHEFGDLTAKCSNQLSTHKTTHTGESPFNFSNSSMEQCPSKRSIRKRKCEKKTFFACEDCDFRTCRTNDLTKHRRIHTGEKHLKCNVCDYSTRWAGSLSIHKRKHTGEKPFMCDLCDYRAI